MSRTLRQPAIALVVVCAGVALTLKAVVALEICSGETERTEKCATETECTLANNCEAENVYADDVAKCSEDGASDASNCIPTSSRADCGDRYKCVEKRFIIRYCEQTTKLGDIYYYLPTDGGDCIVE